MTAGRYNLVIEAGATFDHTMTWESPADSPVDLSTYTARAQIRGSADAPGSALLELTTENGKIVLGGALGTIQLLLSATETAALAWENGVWDLEMIVGSTVRRLLEGQVTVRPNVTR